MPNMEKFDATQVKTSPVARNDTDFHVLYRDEMVGGVRLAENGNNYLCWVKIKKQDQVVNQECGRSSSIDTGARSVAEQWCSLTPEERPN